MKLLVGARALFVAAAVSVLSAFAQTTSNPSIDGIWQGTATLRGGQTVPVTIRISGPASNLTLALLNGPAAHPDEAPASSVTFDGAHLVASYDYFARKLDATLTGDTLTGTYGSASPSSRGGPTSFTATRIAQLKDPVAAPGAPDIQGSWEIATTSAKGEAAWEFRVDPPTPASPVVKAVIQRIDGDTGGLWGVWNGTSFNVGHFNAAGAALYSITPQPDGTLQIKNLTAGSPSEARRAPAALTTVSPTAEQATPPGRPSRPSEYIARRPAQARALNLPKPTEPTQQTTVKDPNVPFAFSFPDLAGNLVSNTDPRFRGKVVIVAIGGSWCPNCHDEAPFLVQLYRKYHARGLEIVNLDFEQGDPETDTARLKAFIRHYNIPYPVLLAGTTDQLQEKIPQAVNLNCWPTAFILGRDGKVREVHAGFAGPGNTAGHLALVNQTTTLLETLLASPAPQQTAAR